MEILVADQPEKTPVALGRLLHAPVRQVVAPADQRGRVAVLQAAIAFVHRQRQECVAIERRARLARLEKPNVRLAQAGQIGLHPVQIQPRHTPADGDFVRHAVHAEAAMREAARLDWAVDQRLVVLRQIRAELTRAGAARGGQP